MQSAFSVGDATIHRIVEQVVPFSAPRDFLPDLTEDLLEANRGWMEPTDLDPASGKLILTIQSYLLRTPHHTILIDTCVGNDKNNPRFPAWNHKQDDTWLANLAAAGARPEDIDYVMCTHMHVGAHHVIDILGAGAGGGEVCEPGIVLLVVPGGKARVVLVVADAGVDQDGVVRGTQQVGLDREDQLARGRVEVGRLHPAAIGFQ